MFASALLATAPPARADTAPQAEVVTRASGAAGWAPLRTAPWPGVVSSSGRFAVYSNQLFASAPDESPAATLYVRDIAANTTTEIVGGGSSWATGLDKSDRIVSFVSARDLDPKDTNGKQDLYLYDVQTKQRALVSRDSGLTSPGVGVASGLIAGDGRSVVFNTLWREGYGAGVWRRDLATNTTTKLGPQLDVYEEITSVSDDGRTYATKGLLNSTGTLLGAVVRGSARVKTPTEPRVSPDGRWASWTDPAYGPDVNLVVRDLTTGAEQRHPVPTDGEEYVPELRVLWMSADGSQIAVAKERASDTFTARLWSRSTATFAKIGGPFGGALATQGGGPTPAAVSRTGRFALIRGQEGFGPLWVADVWNQGLPGGVDLPPASAYAVWMPEPLGGPEACEGRTATFSIYPLVAPQFAPAAVSTTVELSAGAGRTASVTALPGRPLERATLEVGKGDAVTVKVTVTLPGGKVLSGGWVESTVCY